MDFRHLSRGIAAADRMRLRGMTPNGHLLWERLEADNLRFGHPDYRSVIALNVRRTLPAHYSKAGRLGITKSRAWQDNDLLKLHRHFPRATRQELEAMFPTRTWAAICSRARKDGYRRRTKTYRPTGVTVFDQILARCVELNLTLRDLDAEVAGVGYFSTGRFRRQKLRAPFIVRAVKYLGGRIRAR